MSTQKPTGPGKDDKSGKDRKPGKLNPELLKKAGAVVRPGSAPPRKPEKKEEPAPLKTQKSAEKLTTPEPVPDAPSMEGGAPPPPPGPAPDLGPKQNIAGPARQWGKVQGVRRDEAEAEAAPRAERERREPSPVTKGVEQNPMFLRMKQRAEQAERDAKKTPGKEPPKKPAGTKP